jgi:hypothetical protein
MYWTNQLVNCRGDSRAVWANVKRLLQPLSTSSTSLAVTDFATHFRQKIANVRQSTANASDPVIVPRAADALRSFDSVTVQEVTDLLRKLPAKQCALDPIPTWLVKKVADYIAPLFCLMCNLS